MSEYQYYEFLALDRPLSKDELAELRAISSRAQLSPTRFVNVYNFGDFGGDPLALMERYFDLFVYVANWGTHQLMIRLARDLADLDALAPYGDKDAMENGLIVHQRGAYVVLEFNAHDEEGDSYDDGGERWMTELLPLRAALAGGDLRALYLGWLAGTQWDVAGEDEPRAEPPPPLGLRSLTLALQALVEFLRIRGGATAPRGSTERGHRRVRRASARSGTLDRRLARYREGRAAPALRRRRGDRRPHRAAATLSAGCNAAGAEAGTVAPCRHP